MCCVEFQPLIPNGDSTSIATDEVPSLPQANNCWLIKMEESTRSKLQLLNPISNLNLRYSLIELSPHPIEHLIPPQTPILMPILRDLKSPSLSPLYLDGILPTPTSTVTVIAIFHEGNIGYWRNGDKDQTFLDGRNLDCDDLTD
ncbi:unnamed protein product [Linum trigynum]|uniref:Uncharacterized protein n=1 Tax=Linum trigynum TaxID=586398 RepID=A0AAV2E832_9ROSI